MQSSRRKPPNPMCVGNGGTCGNHAMDGATVCWSHGGAAPHVKAKAAVRALAAEYTSGDHKPGHAVWGDGNPNTIRRAARKAELMNWGPADIKEDPGEVLLRLVAQSSRRVALYADLLQQQYDLADAGEDSTELPGGIHALIGHKYALTKSGDAVAVEEAIRGLVELEMREREFCLKASATAAGAGLGKQLLELQQSRIQLMADTLRAILGDPDVALSPAQRRAAQGAIRRHLALAE